MGLLWTTQTTQQGCMRDEGEHLVSPELRFPERVSQAAVLRSMSGCADVWPGQQRGGASKRGAPRCRVPHLHGCRGRGGVFTLQTQVRETLW